MEWAAGCCCRSWPCRGLKAKQSLTRSPPVHADTQALFWVLVITGISKVSCRTYNSDAEHYSQCYWSLLNKPCQTVWIPLGTFGWKEMQQKQFFIFIERDRNFSPLLSTLNTATWIWFWTRWEHLFEGEKTTTTSNRRKLRDKEVATSISCYEQSTFYILVQKWYKNFKWP